MEGKVSFFNLQRGFGKILDDDEIIYLMIEYPKLIERPIVINKQKAIIGRPPENIKQVL